MVDFYTVLEVGHDASPEEIKRSYHRLALKYHPDKAGPEGAAKFKEISVAYEVLSDPQKKSIYDTYGEAGLDAMDNPVAGGAVAALGPTVSILIALALLFVVMAMILIFLAFLVSYVDGHLKSWNYVKVFSPLFVIDVLLGVPAVLLFFALLITMPKYVPIHCILLAILCAVILTIVIPIAKDRNETRAAQGRTDYLKWRVWLIPGYLFSVFVFIAAFFLALPTHNRLFKLKSMGLVRLANYKPVSFVLTMLQASCVVVFFALVACRADEIIKTNYFVIIGVPIFVCLTLFLVNQLVHRVLELYLGEVPPEVQAGAQAAEAAFNGGEPPAQTASRAEEREVSGSASTNPMRDPSNEQQQQQQQHYSTESANHSNPEGTTANGREQEPQPQQQQSSGNSNNHSNDSDERQHHANGSTNPYAGQHASYGDIAVHMVLSCLIVGLMMASTAMIAVRLNYYHNYRTYAGVLSLAKACIPLFFIFGALVIATLVGCLLVGCGVASVVVGEPMPHHHDDGEATGNQQEAEEEEMQGTNTAHAASNNNNNNNAAAEEEAPDVPHQDTATTGRPAADQRPPLHTKETTPPERQPDNEHLSDID